MTAESPPILTNAEQRIIRTYREMQQRYGRQGFSLIVDYSGGFTKLKRAIPCGIVKNEGRRNGRMSDRV